MDKRNSVIIVDDNKTLLAMLKEGLLLEGYLCETATSAEAALEQISKNSFGIMVADIIMPGMKGIELAEKAKKLRPDMVIIIMTGYIDDFSYDKAIEAGAVDFIKKPFTLKELMIKLKHVKLQEKLRMMAITDELTGLCNRRGFFTLAEQQLKLAMRHKKGIFMLYADLDGLKSINDTFGHQEGDRALSDAASILKKTCRESDIVARVGGDEFAVIPLGHTVDQIGTITTRLQKNIENHNEKGKRQYTLSMSFGVSYFDPENPCSIDELVAHADTVMYEHKKLKKS
ncbi:MAG TPA: diguanylate cyclase response regulator [Nitrospiraceae bacterium]|jgi:diguanylate cyclase (GGDEF)-like protein|nr:diguanylate cyclase response regulator [Nitrospiraceae bacterium]